MLEQHITGNSALYERDDEAMTYAVTWPCLTQGDNMRHAYPLDGDWRIEGLQESLLATLSATGNDNDNDSHDDKRAVIVLYDAMQQLPPLEACRAGLWVYLAHHSLRAYMARRWLSDTTMKASHKESIIKARYFIHDKSRPLWTHGIARLWWIGHMLSRCAMPSLEEGLFLLFLSPPIGERLLAYGMSAEIFTALMRVMADSYHGDRALFQEATFSSFLTRVDIIGGRTMLNALPAKELYQRLSSLATDSLM